MVAGLPGTGIGGLFYLALVLWLPVRELALMCRGRSSPARWRAIGGLWLLVGVMVGVVFAQAWAVDESCQWLAAHTPPDSVLHSASVMAEQSWAASFALLPVYILAGVLVGVHGLRLMLALHARGGGLRRMLRLRGRRVAAGQPIVVLGKARAA